MPGNFQHAHYLYLLFLAPVLAWVYAGYRQRMHPTLLLPSLPTAPGGYLRTGIGRTVLFILRLSAICLVIVALANPQSTSFSSRTLPVEGIDLMFVTDVSASMLAEDLKPNRLEALKAVASRFIAQRQHDRLGLVAFAGESVTVCPLTTNHALLGGMIQRMEEVPLSDGTAIGLGLASAVNRLRASKATSRVIILMTDGENTAGYISPQDAAEMAVRNRIKVYTIGIGTNGKAPHPIQDFSGRTSYRQVPVRIDEELLKALAHKTGGRYFRATDNAALEQVYADINRMEKSRIRQRRIRHLKSGFVLYAGIAVLMLGLEAVMKYTIFRSPM